MSIYGPCAAGTLAIPGAGGCQNRGREVWARPSLTALNSPSQGPTTLPNKPVPGLPHPSSQHSARFAGSYVVHIHRGREAVLRPHPTLPWKRVRVRTAHCPQLPRSPAPAPGPDPDHSPQRYTPLPFLTSKSPPPEVSLQKGGSAQRPPLPQVPWTLGDLPVAPDACSSCDCVCALTCLRPVRSPRGCPQGQRPASAVFHICFPETSPHPHFPVSQPQQRQDQTKDKM